MAKAARFADGKSPLEQQFNYDAMGGLFNIAHDARLVGERIAAS